MFVFRNPVPRRAPKELKIIISVERGYGGNVDENEFFMRNKMKSFRKGGFEKRPKRRFSLCFDEKIRRTVPPVILLSAICAEVCFSYFAIYLEYEKRT